MTVTAFGWIAPDWPVPEHVRVVSTLRGGGVSEGPYASLNLAAHVGDRPEAVTTNRLLLSEAAQLPAEPLWLEQVHGNDVVRHEGRATGARGDASVAFAPGRVCAVMTADCLPVVLADRQLLMSQEDSNQSRGEWNITFLEKIIKRTNEKLKKERTQVVSPKQRRAVIYE